MVAKTWAGSLGTAKVDVFYFDPDEVVVVDDPNHPSGLYRRSAKHAPREDLIALFGALGWITSSVVVLRKDGDEFLVAAGNDRVISLREYNRRARRAGKEPLRMLCARERGGEEQVTGVTVGENEGRRILDPVERAEGWAKYLATGKSEQQGAAMAGMTLTEFKAMMTVLEVSPGARAKIKAGDLPPSAAVTLVRANSEQQEKAIARLPKKAGVRDVIAAVKQVKREKAGDASPVLVAPKTSIVRKLLAALSRRPGSLSAADALKWVLGDDSLSAGAREEVERLLALGDKDLEAV